MTWAARTVTKGFALLALFASTGCSLNLLDSENGKLATNTCGGDSDCPGGTCWSGMCVSNQGSLSGVLIQVTPPTSVASVGGTRLSPCDSVGEATCLPKNVFSLTQSSSDFKLHLPAAMSVDGYVLLDDMTGCESLRVTLIPLEQGYGLPAVSYVAQAAAGPDGAGICPVQSSGARGARFSVNAAPGRYDIYLEPAVAQSATGDGGTAAKCNVVPRLFREVPIATKTCLSSSPPQTLNLKIQWPPGSAGIDSLANWTADIIHPTTGQLLSERKTVPADGNVAIAYSEVLVRESGTVVREDPGQDLVRLTPPTGVTAPVIQLVRSGLEALSEPNNGVTPPLGPFPAPVHMQGWVYDAEKYKAGQAQEKDLAVPSTLSMTATNIPGVTPGIFASFTIDPVVNDKGSFEAEVLPGDYRVRVVPRAGQGLAVLETSLSVRCVPDPKEPARCASIGTPNPAPDGGHPNEGKTLLVPRAATLRGGVAAGFGGGKIDDATVQALPAAFGKRACVLEDGGFDAGGPDAGCAVSKVGVLDVALGEGGFVPRAASATAAGGSFTMTEVDCGGCGEGGPPAYFDMSVRTLDGSRFPWFVRTGVAVESDLNLGQLSLPLPIVQQGVVDIPNGPAEKPTPVAGALITAYVMRNDLGAYVHDPAGMKSCTSVGSGPQQPDARCIRSVLQVGETRAANDGSFELVLPSSIE
jgi:hypothetical protein